MTELGGIIGGPLGTATSSQTGGASVGIRRSPNGKEMEDFSYSNETTLYALTKS
jgi:hypothetical protein